MCQVSDEAAATNDAGMGDTSEPSSSHSDCSSHDASDSYSSTTESSGVPDPSSNTDQSSAFEDSAACRDTHASKAGFLCVSNNSCFSVMARMLTFVLRMCALKNCEI